MRASRPTGRLATLTAAALALLAIGPLTAAHAAAPQVTLVTPSGAQHTLSLEALAGTEDLVDQAYPVRSEAGETSATVTGFSIAALLDAANIDPYGFSYLEVRQPGGGAVQLSNAQALAEPPPVVYATPTGTAFLRPSSGTSDYNATDGFEAPQGLTIALRKGASLQVRLDAAPRKTTVGTKVRFHAIVERAGSGEELNYHWYFDDGNSAEGESVEHAYAKPGSYSIVVGVKAAGEDTGTSAVVRIQVGEPAKGGPNREGGGTNKAQGAPDHGAAEGESGEAPSEVPTGSNLSVAGSDVGGTLPSQQRGGSSRVPPTSREPKRHSTPKSKPDRAPANVGAPERLPTGEEVSGELISGEVEAKPEAVAPPKQVAARTGTPQPAGPGGGGGVPTAAWGIGAVVALLAGGALVEAGAFTDLIPRLRERLR